MNQLTLTSIEISRLDSCEKVIERGLESFVEVGDALLTIRDNRLYRQTHSTFEKYCRERWGLKRQRAYELIGAYEVVDAMSEISDIPPPSVESHTAELAPFRDHPEALAEVWKEVSEKTNGHLTAADIREHVQRHLADR